MLRQEPTTPQRTPNTFEVAAIAARGETVVNVQLTPPGDGPVLEVVIAHTAV